MIKVSIAEYIFRHICLENELNELFVSYRHATVAKLVCACLELVFNHRLHYHTESN